VGDARAGSSPAFGTNDIKQSCFILKPDDVCMKLYRVSSQCGPHRDKIFSDDGADIIIMLRIRWKKFVFYAVKLPLIFMTIPVGFLFDFLVTFPSIILCSLDARLKNKG
jgi:hypothetical protein